MEPGTAVICRLGALLSNYFIKPPAGYARKYLFEIDEKLCTSRRTVSTPDAGAIRHG